MNALTFLEFGGPEVLNYQPMPDPVLKEGEVLVAMEAIGLNYADIYRRQGNYSLSGNPPYINGYEGAGIIINNNRVGHCKNGDRVCFADVPFANAELVAVPYENLIPLPHNLSFLTAATCLLQGLTAHYLTNDSYKVKADETVLIHACAGGVGQLLIQICKARDAYVIGLTSSEQKRKIALDIGADEVYLYHDDWPLVLSDKNIHVVYESTGSTLLQSLAVVKESGTVVFYGFAGGNPPLVDPRVLMDGSKTITGGDLWSYLHCKEERIRRCNELFDWIQRGVIAVEPSATYSLKEGAAAHKHLESRQSVGKIILVP